MQARTQTRAHTQLVFILFSFLFFCFYVSFLSFLSRDHASFSPFSLSFIRIHSLIFILPFCTVTKAPYSDKYPYVSMRLPWGANRAASILLMYCSHAAAAAVWFTPDHPPAPGVCWQFFSFPNPCPQAVDLWFNSLCGQRPLRRGADILFAGHGKHGDTND